MLEGFVSGFIVGWVLTWFDIDQMVLEVIQPLTSVQLTTAHFYVALGLIGLIGGVFGK